MRKPSRIDPVFLINQATRREVLNDSDPNEQNSVPALRERVTLLEELLAVRNYVSITPTN